MGYDYGYGYSPYSPASSLITGSAVYTIFVVIAFIVALVLSFFLFFKFVAKPEGKELKQTTGGGGFMQRFLSFKQLIVGDVMRWFYIFTALLVALEGIVTTIYIITLITLSGWFLLFAVLNIGFVFLIELAVRIMYEMQMLTVLIANDTSAIHSILANHYGPSTSTGAGFDVVPAQAQPQPAYHAQAGWKCPTCGTTGNQGAFCKQCGTPRM